jgi:hypothetical protein
MARVWHATDARPVLASGTALGHHAQRPASVGRGSLPAQAGWTGSTQSRTMRPGSNGEGGMRIGTGNNGCLDRPEPRVGLPARALRHGP